MGERKNLQLMEANHWNFPMEEFYCDVFLHTERNTIIKAHRMELAKCSKWFHNYFQTSAPAIKYDILLIGISPEIVHLFLDLIRKNVCSVQSHQKKHLSTLLDRLQVQYKEYSSNQEKSVENEECAKRFKKDEAYNENSSQVQLSQNNLSGEQVSENQNSFYEAIDKLSETEQNSFYRELDQFTETNAEELLKISHAQYGEVGKPDRGYQCLQCLAISKYFSIAERHFLSHEDEKHKVEKEKLRSAELDRQCCSQILLKIEKNETIVDVKKLTTTFENFSQKLHEDLLMILDVERQNLPPLLKQKCVQFKNLNIKTNDKLECLKKKFCIL